MRPSDTPEQLASRLSNTNAAEVVRQWSAPQIQAYQEFSQLWEQDEYLISLFTSYKKYKLPGLIQNLTAIFKSRPQTPLEDFLPLLELVKLTIIIKQNELLRHLRKYLKTHYYVYFVSLASAHPDRFDHFIQFLFQYCSDDACRTALPLLQQPDTDDEYLTALHFWAQKKLTTPAALRNIIDIAKTHDKGWLLVLILATRDQTDDPKSVFASINSAHPLNNQFIKALINDCKTDPAIGYSEANLRSFNQLEAEVIAKTKALATNPHGLLPPPANADADKQTSNLSAAASFNTSK